MSEPKANPFLHMGQYYWTDADQQIHGPFKDARSALQDLLRTQDPLFFDNQHRVGIVSGFITQMGLIILGITFIYWLLK
jgi:hypothetical protein